MVSDVSSAISQKLKEVDIHVITSTVKMFFRSLPDPLFTERLYSSFAEGIGEKLYMASVEM
jgi:hypothetical protein